MPARRRSRPGTPRRVATLSVHTSPLDQPGAGDAGGMNVYIVEVSRRLAARGIAVDIFTRATSSDLPPVVEMSPGVTVRHVSAGPFEGLGKEELPGPAVRLHRRRPARGGPARAGLLRRRPLALLALRPGRLAGPRPVERAADPHRAHAGQGEERGAGRRRPARAARPGHRRGAGRRRGRPADRQHRRGGPPARPPVRRRPRAHPRRPARVSTSSASRPADRAAARRRLGIPEDAVVLLFVGRIQPLKAPDVLLHAAAADARRRPRAPRSAARPRGRARPAAPAWTRPSSCRSSPATSASPTSSPSSRRSRRSGSPSTTAAADVDRRPQPQRVLRAGRAGGAGLRHPRRRRRGRGPADGGPRRRLRRPRPRARPARLRGGRPRGPRPPRAALRRRPPARLPVLLGPHRRRPRRGLHPRGEEMASRAAAAVLAARPLRLAGPARHCPGIQVAR